MQATIVTLVLLVARGRIEEPESVVAEREELARLLETATPEERAELEREISLDPVTEAPSQASGALASRSVPSSASPSSSTCSSVKSSCAS